MTFDRRTFTAAAGTLAAGAWLPRAAFAQAAYPSRPLRIICPFTPGGGSDFMARVAAGLLTERLARMGD